MIRRNRAGQVGWITLVALLMACNTATRWSLQVANVRDVPILVRLVEAGTATDYLIPARGGGMIAVREAGFRGIVQLVDNVTCAVVADAGDLEDSGDYYVEPDWEGTSLSAHRMQFGVGFSRRPDVATVGTCGK